MRFLKAEVGKPGRSNPYKHLSPAKSYLIFLLEFKNPSWVKLAFFAFRTCLVMERQRSHDHNSIFLRQIKITLASGLKIQELACCIGFKSKSRVLSVSCFSPRVIILVKEIFVMINVQPTQVV